MDYRDDKTGPLRVMPKIIEATLYNHARLALKRLGNPLRIELPEHRGLEVILNNDQWQCVDSTHDDQLIMVWCDFDTRKRNSALYENVPCTLRLYHSHAGLVMGTALEALDLALTRLLAYSTG